MPGERQAGRLRRRDDPDFDSLLLDGNPDAVREGLARLFAGPLLSRLDDDSHGTVQIVLAEVLNNIAEHAYARYPGQIEVQLRGGATEICLQTIDRGLPMPDGKLPGGELSETVALEDLPEGGFGWFLIRTLTRGLAYRRQEGMNVLNFCIDVDYAG